MLSSSAREEVEVTDPEAVVVRLSELGAPRNVLLEAVRIGQLAASFTTKAHPVWYHGSKANAETTGSLRVDLASMGWVFNDDDNIARAVRPDGGVILTVLSGNAQTGIKGFKSDPKAQPRRKRGKAGIREVMRNGQIAFVELLPADDFERTFADVATWGPTWFLLYYRDGDIVRCELSLAHGVTEEGDLMDWTERLILPVIDMLDSSSQTGNAEVADSVEIDVPVERLASAG